MSFLMRWLWGQPERLVPSTIETDEILPVNYFDDTSTFRDLVICWTMRFDDVLDANRLHDSLARLLEIGGWKKLGGRLRLNVSLTRTEP